MSLKFGWYGDDFTGATDTLAVAARAGLTSILFLDVPTDEQLARCSPMDAIGIAGTARSMSPQQMQAYLPKVGCFFREHAVPVVHYKCCSTFDSAPSVGSLAAAIRILGPYVGAPFAMIVGGQPDIGRYCCFGNLFAAAGNTGDIYRIDRHPTMQCHPVTPMHEADLRLHLQTQGMTEVINIPYTAYRQQREQLDVQVDKAGEQCFSDTGNMDKGVLFDVSDSAHLESVGRQIRRIADCHKTALVAGSSVVLQAIMASVDVGKPPDNADNSSKAEPARRGRLDPRGRLPGTTFVLAASLSPVTAAQVKAATGYVKIPLQARALLADGAYRAAQCRYICEQLAAHAPVLAYLDQQKGRDTAIQSGDLATGTAQFVKSVMQMLAKQGTRLGSLGIAGGDTSSQAIAHLDVWALSYSSVLSPGVTVCIMHSDNPMLDGVQVMLKGGQMGGEDIFDRLLAAPVF